MTYAGLNARRERREPGAAPMRAHSVKFTDDEWDLVCKLAGEEGTTAGTIIRRAVADYIDAPAVTGSFFKS